jgi:hypothetical protein
MSNITIKKLIIKYILCSCLGKMSEQIFNIDMLLIQQKYPMYQKWLGYIPKRPIFNHILKKDDNVRAFFKVTRRSRRENNIVRISNILLEPNNASDTLRSLISLYSTKCKYLIIHNFLHDCKIDYDINCRNDQYEIDLFDDYYFVNYHNSILKDMELTFYNGDNYDLQRKCSTNVKCSKFKLLNLSDVSIESEYYKMNFTEPCILKSITDTKFNISIYNGNDYVNSLQAITFDLNDCFDIDSEPIKLNSKKSVYALKNCIYKTHDFKYQLLFKHLQNHSVFKQTETDWQTFPLIKLPICVLNSILQYLNSNDKLSYYK